MPNTYGGAISQGISQGLQNVSAMYGLKSQIQKAGQEQELYDIQMKEYQRGQELADWGKVEDFLDAGEYGKNYVQSYAGALGMDPAKMTRREMKDFGQIFLKDQKAAHDLLTLRRRHYGEKVKEYEGKPEFTSELKLFKQKFDESTLLDKEYRAAENYKKTAQSMQEIAQMTDEQLTDQGLVPAIRTIAQSGDVETFGEIMKEVVKAQVKPPTAQMKVVPDSTSATGYSYKDVSGGGVPAPAPGGKETWGVEQEGPGGTKRQVSSTGKVSTTYKPPTGEKSGQNWLLPDRTIVISYDGGRTYSGASGQSTPMPSTAMKVPGGASLSELNINEAKKEAERESRGDVTGTGVSPTAAALKGTGPYERIASMFEAVAGGAGLDVLVGQNGFFPEMADAKQYLRSVKQMGKAALMNSSRGAIWEQQRIDELFPDPDKTFTNPRIEARKFGNLLGILKAEKTFNNQAIVNALTPKEVEKYRASNNEIDRLMSLISEPSTGGVMGGITAQDKSLVDKYRRRK